MCNATRVHFSPQAPFWIHIYGSPSIWPLFVSMYNGPGLPCLLFLKWLDPKVEARLGLARAYALRCTLPLVLSTVLVIIIPFADHIVGVMAPLLFLLGLSNAAICECLAPGFDCCWFSVCATEHAASPAPRNRPLWTRALACALRLTVPA